MATPVKTPQPAAGASPPVPAAVVKTLAAICIRLVYRAGVYHPTGGLPGTLAVLGIPHDDAAALTEWLESPR